MTRATMPTLVQNLADWDTNTGRVLSVQVPPDPRLYRDASNNAAVSVKTETGTQTYLLDNPTPGMIVALLSLAQSGREFSFFSFPNSNYIPSLFY